MISLVIFLVAALLVIMYIKFRNYVPILMYHRIADVPGDRNSLPAEKFEEQLRFLAQNGYTAITPDMLYMHYTKQKRLPRKSVLLTFDDGYHDNYMEALPLLQKYNMTAVVFPIYNWIGKKNQWENFGKQETTTMTEDELRLWLNAGMDVQVHTLNHPFLTECKDKQLKEEVAVSKRQFEQLLKRPMEYLCYPYGFFDKRVIDEVRKASYKMAFAIFDNVPLWQINLFALPRIPVPSHQKMWEFKLKVSSIHVIFIAMRKWERDFKKLKRKMFK